MYYAIEVDYKTIKTYRYLGSAVNYILTKELRGSNVELFEIKGKQKTSIWKLHVRNDMLIED